MHGQFGALVEVLAQILPVPGDRLIFLGDIVDRGPDTCGVIKHLLWLLTRGIQVDVLMGNHEFWFLAVMAGVDDGEDWFRYGGEQTMASYDHVPPVEHLDFLRSLPTYCDMEIGSQRHLFVHGGFDPDRPIKVQLPDDLMWDRDLWDTHCFRVADAGVYDRVWIGHQYVYGTGVVAPETRGLVTMIDGGAGYDGHLVAVDVQSDQVYQSVPVGSLAHTS